MSIQVYLLEKTYLENEYSKLKFKLTTLESNIKTLDIELQGNIDPYIELFTIDEIIKQNKHENEVIKNVL